MDQNLERFIRYVKIDTQSDENSLTTPSTEKQYNLLNLLKEELKALDIDSEIDEHGRLYAKVKGEEGYPTIGLNSHVDTASELTGKNVKNLLFVGLIIIFINGGGLVYKSEKDENVTELSLTTPGLLKNIGEFMDKYADKKLVESATRAVDSIKISNPKDIEVPEMLLEKRNEAREKD